MVPGGEVPDWTESWVPAPPLYSITNSASARAGGRRSNRPNPSIPPLRALSPSSVPSGLAVGAAIIPQESTNTWSVGHRNRSCNRHETSCGTFDGYILKSSHRVRQLDRDVVEPLYLVDRAFQVDIEILHIRAQKRTELQPISLFDLV